MKRSLWVLVLVFCLLLSAVSCASKGGELQKKPGTVDNNRVIGAQEDETAVSSAVPASTGAAQSTPSASSSAAVILPPATAQSGTVRDEQDLDFRLRLEWTATPADGGVTVDTRLYLDCYTLTVNSSKSGSITVNGAKRSFRTDKISETDNTLHSIRICEESFAVSYGEIPASGILVEAEWNFNGSYGGQSIETLCLSETITIG